MKKILILLIIVTQTTIQSFACDACGCGLGGYYFGILPQYQSHFIGMRYSRSRFRSIIDNRYAADEYSSDTYTRIELMGRYSLTKKTQFYFNLPYVANDMNGNLQKATSSGLGDPILLGYYNVFNTGDQVLKTWRHSLKMGAGVKIPLGEYLATDNDELLNRNFQLGTGSLDYLLSANYTLRRENLGVIFEGAYKINGTNRMHYRFGNQFNLSGGFFHVINTKSITFLPLFGGYYETSASHEERGIIKSNTGGNVLLINLSIQVFTGNFTFHFTFQKPVVQEYYSDSVTKMEGGNRMITGLIYNFTFQKKNQMVVPGNNQTALN